MRKSTQVWITILLVAFATVAASAQSFRVQCPTGTVTHPAINPSSPTGDNNSEAPYSGPTAYKCSVDGGCPGSGVSNAGTNNTGYLVPVAGANGAIKCQQISGGDGYSTMADGTQTYMFSFGPLSGLADIANGLPGTQFPYKFNEVYAGANVLQPGDPATTDKASDSPYAQGDPSLFTYNGAIGQVVDADAQAAGTCGAAPKPSCIDGHVDPRQIMDVGAMNGNIPAPLMAIDEDDEFFLTLTNVGMIMRPDLFEQHTVHFHGYPNASAFYDGVPDASVAINIGGSFTYYYLAPDAGTYFWHCHITPPEHLQMGMVGQLYVRPRQDRVPAGTSLFTSLGLQNGLNCSATATASTCTPLGTLDLRTACNSATDILCSNPLPAVNTGAVANATVVTGPKGTTGGYAYNDGDGSTWYDVEYPLQMHGFDPNFHFVGMTFNPEGFTDMKDKYFLLNGRSYPDTVATGPLATQSVDGSMHYSQPLNAIITIPHNGRALLRISNLSVSEYHTLASLGVQMTVVGYNAKLLRDQAGNNLYYKTNSITLGGGESLDVILDATGVPSGTYYLYTPNLDHLSNDAENFGGEMTEVRVN